MQPPELQPPGPRGRPILGSLKERRDEPLKLYMSSALKYGDVVRFKMGPLQVFQINSPAGIKHVLQDNHRNYSKGRMYDVLSPLLGQGLLTSEGDFWRRQRKLAQPAFHRQRLVGFAKSMTEATAGMLMEWDHRFEKSKDEPFDVAHEMMRLTLTIVSRTLLSTDVSGDADSVGAALTRLIEETNRRLLSLIPLPWDKIPTPRSNQFKRDVKTLNDVVFRIIEERRRHATGYNDLLSMLMEVRDEETGESMDDRQLRDEVMTIFLAGHETTANALAWTLHLLSKHPDVARRLRAEINEVLGDRTPTFEDVPHLKYTHQVLEETLRLYPPAWIIAREALAEDKIDGYHIPAGAIMVVVPYVTHRHPKYWENPEGFDPDRFGEAAGAGHTKMKYTYFPFGGGPRQCIGNGFAMMEAQLILAMITQRYRLDLVPGIEVEPEPLITLRPKGGIWMTLHKS